MLALGACTKIAMGDISFVTFFVKFITFAFRVGSKRVKNYQVNFYFGGFSKFQLLHRTLLFLFVSFQMAPYVLPVFHIEEYQILFSKIH